MLNLAAAGMQSSLVAFATIFLALQLTRDRFFVDSGLIVLHFAFLTREVNVGILSAWHVRYCLAKICPLSLVDVRFFVKTYSRAPGWSLHGDTILLRLLRECPVHEGSGRRSSL